MITHTTAYGVDLGQSPSETLPRERAITRCEPAVPHRKRASSQVAHQGT